MVARSGRARENKPISRSRSPSRAKPESEAVTTAAWAPERAVGTSALGVLRATGTGVGTGTNAWAKAPLAGFYPWGAFAVAGALAAGVWSRGADAGLSSFVVGASTATLVP